MEIMEIMEINPRPPKKEDVLKAYDICIQCSDHTLYVPDQDPLVPAATCAPPFGSEQAPIHAHGEFRMSAHSS